MGRTVAAILGAVTTACYSAPALDVGPVPAGVVVETHMDYYDVSAASLSEIRSGLARDGPMTGGRRWHALTTWHMRYEYQSTPRGSSCEATRVRVRLLTSVTFPRWNPTAQPDSALLTWWQRYNAGLAEHERGHAVIAVQGAGQVARALEGTRAMCPHMGEAMRQTFDRGLATLNDAEAEYDLTTRHGATQILRALRLGEP